MNFFESSAVVEGFTDDWRAENLYKEWIIVGEKKIRVLMKSFKSVSPFLKTTKRI